MADNDNVLPLKVGKLPRECYNNWQEFAEDLVKVMQVAQDNKEIIQGAKGETGDRGLRGPKGDTGQPGSNTNITVRTFDIPDASTYVDINIFDGWERSMFNVRYDGRVVPVSAVNPFVEADGYIGVGTIVLIDLIPTPTTFRVYFVFSPGITAVPDENFILHVTTLS
jgi:hypothetical protein